MTGPCPRQRVRSPTTSAPSDSDAKRVLSRGRAPQRKGRVLLAIRALIRWYGEWLDCSDRDKERDLQGQAEDPRRGAGGDPTVRQRLQNDDGQAEEKCRKALTRQRPPSSARSIPSPRQDAPSPARDQRGQFTQVAEKPEPLFEMRIVEGDPDTGDTSDAGDDPRLRQRERDIADGRFDERQDVRSERQSRQAPAETERESRERSLAESG